MDFTGTAFQSSFVVAVLVAAVFLAARIGGDSELSKRGMQIAIALGMVLLVFSGTVAVIRPPAPPAENIVTFDGSEENEEVLEYAEESANRASGAGSIHIAAAVLLVALGIALRRLRVIPTGLLLGGVLLLLLGSPPRSPSSGADVYSSFLFSSYGGLGNAGQVWDILRFVVIVLGVAVLLGLAYARWERGDEDQDHPPLSAADLPPAIVE